MTSSRRGGAGGGAAAAAEAAEATVFCGTTSLPDEYQTERDLDTANTATSLDTLIQDFVLLLFTAYSFFEDFHLLFIHLLYTYRI